MADGIAAHTNAAQAAEHREGQHVQAEHPDELGGVGPFRLRRKQQDRREGHADDADLVRTGFAPAGVGVVDQPADEEVHQAVGDLADGQDQADLAHVQPQIVAGEDGQVAQHDHVDPGGRDVRALPGHQMPKTQVVWVFDFVFCHGNPPKHDKAEPRAAVLALCLVYCGKQFPDRNRFVFSVINSLNANNCTIFCQ